MLEFPISQKFLVANIGNEQNNTINLEGIIQVLWKNHLIDSHVLTKNGVDSWGLYTFLPYQNDCFTPTTLKIESFTKFSLSKPMNLSTRQVYPQKLKYFNGCPLYITVTPFIPMVDNKKNYRRKLSL